MTSAVAIGVAVGSQLRVALPPEPASVRFVVAPPDDFSFRGMMALSPDGQRLALVTIDDKRRTQLWVRSMSSEVAQRVAAADGATYPFWSPDGQSIGFFADRQLKRAAAAGGPPLVICDAEDGRGGTWNKDGVIVFAPRTYSPLVRGRVWWHTATGHPARSVEICRQSMATFSARRRPLPVSRGLDTWRPVRPARRLAAKSG
jgi:hypothetical protein